MKHYTKFILIIFIFGSAFAKPVLNIQHWKNKQGVPVYFVKADQPPMLDINVVFNAGSARDGMQYGLANLTNEILNQGDGKLSTDQVAQQFENIGAQYGNTVGKDMAVLSLRTLVTQDVLKQSLSTFNLVLTQPTFDLSSLSRLKKQTLVALQAQQQNPSAVAGKQFMKLLYGNQPYGHSALGAKETVGALQQKQLKQFYQQYYVQKNAVIVMVGDLAEAKAKKIADKILQGLPEGQAVAPLKKMQQANLNKVSNIKLPIPQTVILMGDVAANANTPDYFPLLVGNYILGSGMSSLLFNVVREENGLTYSIGTQFERLFQPGPFLAMLQTKNADAKKAAAITKQTIAKYLKTGPTAAQLAQAKTDLSNRMPTLISNNGSVMSNVTNLAFYHRPLNFWDNFIENVNAVTPEQIKAAMQKYVKPNQFVTVTVGG